MISFGRWQFDFNDPLIIVLSLLLLASFLLSLRLVSRRLFKRAPLRSVTVMLLNLVAYASVFLLLLEPRFSQQVQQSVQLVTEGAEISRSGGKPLTNAYVAPGVPATAKMRKSFQSASWLLDVEQLLLREPALSKIEVDGFGLTQAQWQAFPQDIQVVFNPAHINGFTDMQWPRSLSEGETLKVSGRYQLPDTEPVIQLRLLDPAGNVVDEARLKSGQPFNLTALTKAPGNLEYKLQAWISELMLSEQVVPLEVGKTIPFNIMIRQSAPSFEARALKEYAASLGHRVYLDTDISKGKAITQSLNLPSDSDHNLSPESLRLQDLLIMDGRALSRLPATQRQWLNMAVENGLGLLVLMDSTLLEPDQGADDDLLNGFQLSPLQGAESMVVPHLLTTNANQWQEAIRVAATQITAKDGDVLVADEDGRSLVIRRQKGLGHVAISLINHSHNWLIAGQQGPWGDYWRALFREIARQRQQGYLLPRANTGFARVNERTAICAFGTEGGSRLSVDALTSRNQATRLELELTPDSLNSPRKCAFFWPGVSGWHQLRLYSPDGDAVLDQKAVYVFGADQWLAQQRSERLRATLARTSTQEGSPPERIARLVSVPLNPFFLWLVFVLSASFLWLERKLDLA